MADQVTIDQDAKAQIRNQAGQVSWNVWLNDLRKLGRKALANRRCHFFFFAGLSDFSDFLAVAGLLSAFFADFFGSASFFLSFFWEDFERAEAAADFFVDDDFLSFNSLLAFEASPLLFFSSLAILRTSRSMPVLAHWPVRFSTS
jgi:hypothetical protein